MNHTQPHRNKPTATTLKEPPQLSLHQPAEDSEGPPNPLAPQDGIYRWITRAPEGEDNHRIEVHVYKGRLVRILLNGVAQQDLEFFEDSVFLHIITAPMVRGAANPIKVL